MITTIREQMNSSGVSSQDTLFSSCGDALLDFPLSTVPFLEWQQQEDGHMALTQKNMAEAMPLPVAARSLGVSFSGLPEDMPWFCDGLPQIAEALHSGRPIAVEGGPCLFGVDEVMAEVVLHNGTGRMFDESTGRYAGDHGMLLPEYLAEHAAEIAGVRFHDRKTGVTSQERDSIEWLFRVARPLGARVVLPLPDMSYGKYLAAITQPLDPQVARQVREDFARVTSRIAGLYIRLTARLAQAYPEVPYCIVHGGDAELCARYYEARMPYIERHKILRNITNIPEKLEAIKDYISMPALPYYLYGITDVIQVDSLDELDSYRRCRRAHRRFLNLACMLYPERLSKDGVHTIFQAAQSYKEYL